MSALFALALTALAVGPAPTPTPDAVIARWVRGVNNDRPKVNVWLNRDDVYQRGDRVRVYFKSDQDAYVTVVRIDTDGRLRILFPVDPWEDNWARGGKTFEVLGRDRDEAFQIDDYAGVGYVFAIASEDPTTYDQIVRGDHWDYRAISDGRVRGDPYIAVSDLAERIAVEGGYDYDVVQYDVERHYDYPRFVCYDCHGYSSYISWDPYRSSCSRFRIVIYDDWYYYPYRRYNRGVYVGRPYRPGPRYVFKDSDPRNNYITRVAERPRGADPRRPVERDRTSADVGGRGAIPAPVDPRRRTSGVPDRTSPSDAGRRPTTRDPSVDRGSSPATGSDPRRRPDDRPSPSDRTNAPSTQSEPRRRPESPNSPRSESGGMREVPDRGSPEANSPSRRGDPGRGDSEQRGQPDRSGQPAPDRRPSSTEPRREPSSQAQPREAPRPRNEPSARPSSPPPRSTGEPQLKRRRPN